MYDVTVLMYVDVRFILSFHSPHFKAMFDHNFLENATNETELNEFPPEILLVSVLKIGVIR